MTTQPDLYRDSPDRVVAAWMAAAETALQDRQFTDAERQRRHDYYMREADRIEREAGEMSR